MHNSRLISLAKTLTPGEMRRFDTFLASPFFNSQEKLLDLWRFLHQAAPDFPAKIITKQKAFSVLYPDESTYREQKVHDHSSVLLKLLERFLGQLTFEKDEYLTDISLLTGLQDRMPEQFARRYKQVVQQLEDNPRRDGAYHLSRLQLAQMGDSLGGELRKRNISRTLTDSLEFLDIHFLATKLKTTCELINRQKIIRTEYSVAMMEEIESFLDQSKNAYLEIPVVAIYYQIYRMLRYTEEANYRQLLHLLDKHNGAFSPKEAYSMYAYAQNFCIRQINTGNPAFLEELFQIYQRLLDAQLLLQAGILPHEHYKNITTVGLRLRHFEWVADFLEQFKGKLDPAVRENAYTYNLAVYYMEKGAFKQAMRLLQQVTFTDVYYDLSARAILLRVYYELEEDDALGYLVHAFNAFLKRNKLVSQDNSRNLMNLIRFVKKLTRLRQRKAFISDEEFSTRVQKIKTALQASPGVSNANWLRAKIQALETEA